MKHQFLTRKLKYYTLLTFILTITHTAFGQTITTFAAQGRSSAAKEKQPAHIDIEGMSGGVTDKDGNLFVADLHGSRILKITAQGIVSVIAGTGEAGFSGDGGAATGARLRSPSGLAFDQQGNLYVADCENNRIRKINLATDGSITTIAGNGETGFSGNGGKATKANFQSPSDVVVDNSGNVYVSDYGNNCIRKINPSGIITAFAGNANCYGTGSGKYSGDGKHALNAELNHPKGMCIDDKGSLYFADCFNHRVRKVNTQGIITTIAGNGVPGFKGDFGKASVAELNFPYSIEAGKYGNIFISDHSNNRIREVDNHGIIKTIAGNNESDMAVNAGSLKLPTFICGDRVGNLYIGDNGNSSIKKLNLSDGQGVTNTVTQGMKINSMQGGHFITN